MPRPAALPVHLPSTSPLLLNIAASRLWAVAWVLCLVCAGAQASEADEVRALLSRGDFSAALQRAEAAAVANPRDAQARFLQGVVLMDMGRDDAALALFTALSQQYPELPDPFNNIALLHARAGRLELARQALDTALRNDPTHTTARANLGQIYLMLAVQTWEQAAASGTLDAPLRQRLDALRALLGSAPSGGPTSAYAPPIRQVRPPTAARR